MYIAVEQTTCCIVTIHARLNTVEDAYVLEAYDIDVKLICKNVTQGASVARDMNVYTKHVQRYRVPDIPAANSGQSIYANSSVARENASGHVVEHIPPARLRLMGICRGALSIVWESGLVAEDSLLGFSLGFSFWSLLRSSSPEDERKSRTDSVRPSTPGFLHCHDSRSITRRCKRGS